MTLSELPDLARNLWPLWLGALFVGIVLRAYWPGRRREMQDHADIPFRESESAQ